MLRRLTYGLVGALLSSGAPIGFLAVRLKHAPVRRLSLREARDEVSADPGSYAYLILSTAAVFSLFGYILGRQVDRLAELSQTDSLTGLRNARGLWSRLREEVTRSLRYRQPVALLLVDVDALKTINDAYGHRVGDQSIRHVANAIRAELRASDIGARCGGDEFAILAPNTSEGSALALGERVRLRIARQSGPHQVTVSIGVAAVDPTGSEQRFTAGGLMRAADMALYDAKAHGRNRVTVVRNIHKRGSASSANPRLPTSRASEDRMAELIHEHLTHIRTPEGLTYLPRTYAAQQPDGVWEAWLEFAPIGIGPTLRTERETSQATREALETWASGLEASYFQGAFARARLVDSTRDKRPT